MYGPSCDSYLKFCQNKIIKNYHNAVYIFDIGKNNKEYTPKLASNYVMWQLTENEYFSTPLLEINKADKE